MIQNHKNVKYFDLIRTPIVLLLVAVKKSAYLKAEVNDCELSWY